MFFFAFVCICLIFIAYVASDTASMASMASSERSTTPDQFGTTDLDPLLLPLGRLLKDIPYLLRKCYIKLQIFEYSYSVKSTNHR